jgi:hypothetical protein
MSGRIGLEAEFSTQLAPDARELRLESWCISPLQKGAAVSIGGGTKLS